MTDEPPVLKQGSCPSHSGATTLAYEIGKAGEDYAFRITANSRGGLFGKN